MALNLIVAEKVFVFEHISYSRKIYGSHVAFKNLGK
jgi:hypothetical protein